MDSSESPSMAQSSGLMRSRTSRIEEDLSKNVEVKEDLEHIPWIDRSWFKVGVGLLVVSNTLLMGLEADYPEWTFFWTVSEHFYTSAFAIEMFVKLFFMRRAYFADRGNLLDMFLVTVAAVDSWLLAWIDLGINMQSLSIFRILRLFRLVRVVRLIKSCRRLVLVVGGMVEAMEATFWVGSVLLLAIYVGAVFCVGFFGNAVASPYPGYQRSMEAIDATEMMMNFNPYLNFGTMGRAMFSLFNIALLAEWTEIVYPVMIYQPPAVAFFVIFVLVTSFGTMNVIIGMICDTVMQNSRKLEQEELEVLHQRRMNILKEVQGLVTDMDEDGDGQISFEELENAFGSADNKLSSLLFSSDLHLPIGFSPEELLCMLDHNGDGGLEREEIVQSIYRLVESEPFQQMCIIQTGLNSLRRLVMTGQQEMREQLASLKASVDRSTDCMPTAKKFAHLVPPIEEHAPSDAGSTLPDLSFMSPASIRQTEEQPLDDTAIVFSPSDAATSLEFSSHGCEDIIARLQQVALFVEAKHGAMLVEAGRSSTLLGHDAQPYAEAIRTLSLAAHGIQQKINEVSDLEIVIANHSPHDGKGRDDRDAGRPVAGLLAIVGPATPARRTLSGRGPSRSAKTSSREFLRL